MACMPADHAFAVREVAQAYELIKSKQPLLQFGNEQTSSSATNNLAQSLLNEALKALRLPLSVMDPQLPAAVSGAGDSKGAMSTMARGKRRRSNDDSSRVFFTHMPHEDGYHWRKYGEKQINGTHFTRNYFRCSYKYDRGCHATKQIQQHNTNDPPMFQVTYNGEHTCSCTTTANKYNNCSYDLPQLSYSNTEGVTIQTSHDMTEQENGQGPRPLVEVSTLLLDLMPSEDPFSFSSQDTLINTYHADDLVMESTGDDLSNIPGVFSDGYLDMEQMALPMETLEGNHFNDLELDVLFDSCWIDN